MPLEHTNYCFYPVKNDMNTLGNGGMISTEHWSSQLLKTAVTSLQQTRCFDDICLFQWTLHFYGHCFFLLIDYQLSRHQPLPFTELSAVRIFVSSSQWTFFDGVAYLKHAIFLTSSKLHTRSKTVFRIHIWTNVHVCYNSEQPFTIQSVTGGTDQTSGECSLGQTIPI